MIVWLSNDMRCSISTRNEVSIPYFSLTPLRHGSPKTGSRLMKANLLRSARSTRARERSATFIVPMT